MTTYTISHLGLAGLCTFLFGLHLLVWGMLKERAQFWMALTFAGYVLVNVGVAGSSVAADGQLGAAGGWVLIGTLGITPIWIGLLMTAWTIMRRRMTPIRWVLVVVAVVVGLVRLAEVLMLVSQNTMTPTWEMVMNSPSTATVFGGWLVTLECGSVCIFEAGAALRKRRGVAVVLAVFATLGAAVIIRETAMTFGFGAPPTYIGLTAFSFMAFSLLTVAFDYVNARTDALRDYKIHGQLGEGGMGAVFLASRTGPAGFERFVAIKKIRKKDDDEWTERFLAEARLAAQLRHPNIVGVHDLGQTEDGWFIVMDYISGASLLECRRHCREHQTRVSPSFVAAVGEKVCRGLARAHRAGIIHRDISPHNIMVTFDGGVKIVDFGIAKEHSSTAPVEEPSASEEQESADTDSLDLTRTGVVVGKRAYLAAERVMGAPATPASDLYALGIVLYELLAGRRPFTGNSAIELARAILANGYTPLEELRPDVPASLCAVIQRALAKSLDIRYGNADAMISDLQSVRQTLEPVDIGGDIQKMFPRKWDADEAMVSSSLTPSANVTPLAEPDPASEASLAPTRPVGISDTTAHVDTPDAGDSVDSSESHNP